MGIFGRLFGRKHAASAGNAPTPRHDPGTEAMTVKPSPGRVESERRIQEEAFALIESQLTASGLFKPESIAAMMAAIRANSPPFRPINANLILGKKVPPGNDGARISLADCLSPTRPRECDPADFIRDACAHSDNQAKKRHELMRMKGIGIKAVRIVFTQNTGACQHVQKMRKPFPVDKAPTLPVPNCDSKLCFCTYKSIIPGLDD